MSKGKFVATGVASVAMAIGATVSMAGTAQAYTPAGLCGSGYTIRASSPLGEGPNATVYLLRNGNSACVVALKNGSSAGNTVFIKAWVQGLDGIVRSDGDNYQYYAGPRKVTSSCVNWGGQYGEYTFKNAPC